MCGIVGYVGHRHAMPILMEGLAQLEYRGYDSAGLALQRNGVLDVIKRCGKLQNLRSALPKRSGARSGIGHTRWATHGEPSDLNAHPHTDAEGQLAVVHNGIIENARALGEFLAGHGVVLQTETDTEVLAHLIEYEFAEQARGDLFAAVQRALRRVSGTYGLAVVHKAAPGEIIVARNGSPVILGIGEKEMFVASDAAALVRHTRQVIYLDDGEVARVRADEYEVQDLSAVPAAKETTEIDLQAALLDKGAHAHYTLKEIEEQPDAIRRTLRGRLDPRFQTVRLGGLNLTPRELLGFRRVKLLGCGSALIAGSIGARVIESLTRMPADAESAAEFRYRSPIIEDDTLYLAVSQSGETFDTLTAVQEIQRKGGTVLGVVNVVGSTIARTCGGGIYLHAGPEVAVVSTKTFVCTLVALSLLALHLGRMRDVSPAEGERLIRALELLPDAVQGLIDRRSEFESLAARYAHYRNAYFIGRGTGYALAREGALKLKEVSYIHAEAYPAAELKHGPLALIDRDTPTIALVPEDDLLVKNLSTLEEIRARSGPILAIGQSETLPVAVTDYVRVSACHPLLDPVLMLIPLQYLAYYAALARGHDVDKPRNLAKSVTVE